MGASGVYILRFYCSSIDIIMFTWSLHDMKT